MIVALVVCVSASLAVLGATIAQGQTAAPTVYFNIASGHPDRIQKFFTYYDGAAKTAPTYDLYLSAITWTDWGGTEAHGSASIMEQDRQDRSRGPFRVNITALKRVDCAGQLVYTAYALTPQPGSAAPDDLAAISNKDFPCYVHARNYVAGLSEKV